MSLNLAIFDDRLRADWRCTHPDTGTIPGETDCDHSLPARITKAASKQTYYTIRLLVDRDRTASAYRAYAYFRWLDDTLDERLPGRSERASFVERQRALVERACRGEMPHDLTPEERMLLNLIRSDGEPNSGLQAYIRNMMAVMSFDAERRGRLISEQELDDYTRYLATAVTEALHYHIGRDQFAPRGEARYLAVAAAHITHMLRDTFEDTAAGYYNIPREFLNARGIAPGDIESSAYREWVKSRVQLARDYFRAGSAHLSRVENNRCRIAGYAYMARFTGLLDTIEREGYRLRPEYRERKSLRAGLRMGCSVLALMLWGEPAQANLPAVTGTQKSSSIG